MLSSMRHTVKKEPDKEDKKKEYILIGICFFIFLITYYVSTFFSSFSFVGYIAAILVVVYLYRAIRQYNYTYTYSIQEGIFSVVQTEGKRNPVILCSYPLKHLICAEKENSDKADHPFLDATVNRENTNNYFLTFKDEEGSHVVAITPSLQMREFFKEYLSTFRQKEEEKPDETESGNRSD